MYLATDKVLDVNRPLFEGLEELTTAQNRLKEYIQQVEANRQVQEANQTGITETKVVMRQELTMLVQKVIAGLTAYSTATKDATLRQKVHYSQTSLARMPDPVFTDVARLILAEARPRVDSLGKYFVMDSDLARLEVLIPQFKAAIPQKRVATNISKVSTLNIADVFAATDKLLKQEIDLLMMPFQFTQPDFYNAYKNARIIVNYSGRGKTPEPADVQTGE